MATVRKDFDSYKVWYYSGFQYEALVHCWNRDTPAGEIVFYKEDSLIPSNETSSNGLPRSGILLVGSVTSFRFCATRSPFIFS